MTEDGRCWCGAIHPAGWVHKSGNTCAYPPSDDD